MEKSIGGKVARKEHCTLVPPNGLHTVCYMPSYKLPIRCLGEHRRPSMLPKGIRELRHETSRTKASRR